MQRRPEPTSLYRSGANTSYTASTRRTQLGQPLSVNKNQLQLPHGIRSRQRVRVCCGDGALAPHVAVVSCIALRCFRTFAILFAAKDVVQNPRGFREGVWLRIVEAETIGRSRSILVMFICWAMPARGQVAFENGFVQLVKVVLFCFARSVLEVALQRWWSLATFALTSNVGIGLDEKSARKRNRSWRS